MEKIASTICINDVNWNEVRNHQVCHAKNKYEAKKEVLAKSNAFADATIQYALYFIHWKIAITVQKLYAIKKHGHPLK